MERTRDAVTDVYADMSPLVRRLARRYAFRHNADLDETMAEANLIFLDVLRTYNREYGSLEARLRVLIPNRLNDAYRRNHGRGRTPTVNASVVDIGRLVTMPPPMWETDAFVRGLPPDAKTVVNLVLHGPPDVDACVWNTPHLDCVRTNLRAYLTNNLGWTPVRVRRAFNDIRLSLLKVEE